MARDKGGRFLPKLGAPIDPNNLPEGGVALLPVLDDDLAPDEWGFKRSCSGFAIDLSPDNILDGARRAVLRHLRTSLLTGVRPDNGAAQAELGTKAASDPDRQSPFRGYKTGFLADSIRSSALRSDGQTATCRIVPPSERNAYLSKAKARGILHMTLDGDSGKAAREAMSEVVAAIATGREILTDKGSEEAGDA